MRVRPFDKFRANGYHRPLMVSLSNHKLALRQAQENGARRREPLENRRATSRMYSKHVVKEGWTVRPLGDVAHLCLGKMLDKNKNRGTPKPYLRNINVRWFEFDLSDMLEMRFEDNERERYTAVKGDVLICEGGYPGRAAVWPRDEPIYFQKAIHRVRFHEPERAKWLVYFLWFSDADGSLRKQFTGAGIQHFTGQALRRLQLPLPPLPEQKRIVANLDVVFGGIAAAAANAEKKLASLTELKQCILQKAFAGELKAAEYMIHKK